MSDLRRLKRLCGLEPDDLADILENNPRAYMAVKGAVAEKHLNSYFKGLKTSGQILDYRSAASDFEKDFYVSLHDGRQIIVECKNVEVQKYNTKNDKLGFVKYIKQNKGGLSYYDFSDPEKFDTKKLNEIINELPQNLKGSGIPRYEYSSMQIPITSVKGGLDSASFLTQFDHSPLSIDFQRTRNSRSESSTDSDGKEARFYKLDEIDVVAACLFTRTMQWEFVFGSRPSLTKHKKHKGRYSKRLILDPKLWRYNFLDMV